eukprot:3541526-Rhodomonas_salina.1
MQGPLDEGEGVGRAYEIGGRAYEIGDHVGVWLDATEGVARFTLNGEISCCVLFVDEQMWPFYVQTKPFRCIGGHFWCIGGAAIYGGERRCWRGTSRWETGASLLTAKAARYIVCSAAGIKCFLRGRPRGYFRGTRIGAA